MIPFHEIRFEVVRALDEYIESLPPEKAAEVSSMFAFANDIFERINSRYRTDFMAPTIKISMNEQLTAEGMEGRVILSSGIVDHCWGCKPPPVASIIPSLDGPRFVHTSIVANVTLAWILAHEQFHVVRMHNRVAEELGSRPEILMPLEHDADLCAAAEIYRLLQGRSRAIATDDEIRQLTLYSIFWTLRTFPETDTYKIHTPMPQRLYHVKSKLAQVETVDGQMVYPNIFSQEAERRTKLLTECLIRCEMAFNGGSLPLPENSILHEFMRLIQTREYLTIVQAWDRIRDDVARITGGRA